MERRFAQTSTEAVVAARDHLAPRVCINVPKSFVMADLVGCLIMGHTTVGIPDGAPMMRRHHLEKAVATNAVKSMTNTRR